MQEEIRVSLISLGCPKNLVDSEVLLGHAVGSGILVAQDPVDSDVAVINTCGFIDSAKAESIATIREVTKLKEEGKLKAVVVVGCLSERYGEELRKQVPNVDAIVGLSDYSRIPALLKDLVRRHGQRPAKQFIPKVKGGERKDQDSDQLRLLLTPKSYAYLRIGEGCDHSCTFCAIPAIRGKQRSKPIEVLVREAEGLARSGVKELVLVAEDSTAYGMDWANKQRLLPELLAALSEVSGIAWLRVLYAYPHTVNPRMTEQLRENPKVLPYLDIPIQHISSRILKAMKRGVSSDQIKRILDRLRCEVPGIAVRSTYIVGFPGETDQEFDELMDLTREYKFERLGVFPYSQEEGTKAYGLADSLPTEVMEERIARIMDLSRQNIELRNRSLVGSKLLVLVDGHSDPTALPSALAGKKSVARSFADAPEIDCLVYLDAAQRSGTMLEVKVTGVEGYDLLAEPVSEPIA